MGETAAEKASAVALEVKEEKETTRVEAFSDGVFAIAITLLVLDLKISAPTDSEGLAYKLAEQ